MTIKVFVILIQDIKINTFFQNKSSGKRICPHFANQFTQIHRNLYFVQAF